MVEVVEIVDRCGRRPLFIEISKEHKRFRSRFEGTTCCGLLLIRNIKVVNHAINCINLTNYISREIGESKFLSF